MTKNVQESIVLTTPRLEQCGKILTIGICKMIPSRTIASAIPKMLSQGMVANERNFAMGESFFRVLHDQHGQSI
jgi:hypothetical protein